MNFFEQQDRSRRATRMLVGLFIAAVLFTCTCIYFAAMLTINTTSLRWTVFGDRACKSIPAVSSTIQLRTIGTAVSIPTIERWDHNLVKSRSFGSGSRRRVGDPPVQNFGERREHRDRTPDRTPYFHNNYHRTYRDRGPIDRQRNVLNSRANCRPQMIWGDLRVFFWTLVGTASVMGGASWWKINQLKSGGAVIAAELGGMRVLPEIATPQEQQLLNIVEEMAIAATMAVPPVYLLRDELGINAFAAGFTINDAVIGITQGSLDQLTRDELQGVIAHEFSHILNGDMAMNIRLMGLLHGILGVHVTGRILTYTGWSRDNPLWIFGVLLRIIGFSGFISGRLIQSAISRQREFLADASAVQFTRNADGIAGALEKIGGCSSQIDSPHAETASHMFFSPALDFSWLEGLFSTHPPLAQRIQVVRGTGRKLGTRIVVNGQVVPAFNPISSSNPAMGFASNRDRPDNEAESASIGGYGALAYTYTLLLDRDLATDQLVYLSHREEPSVLEQIESLRSVVEILPPHQRLSTLDRQLAKIKGTEHAPRLLKCAYGMVEILPPDNWHTALVYLILYHRLAPTADTPSEIYHSIEDVWSESIAILGTLARLSSDRSADIDYAFAASLFRLPNHLASGVKLPPELQWRELQTGLSKIASTAPKVKQSIMAACLEIFAERRQIPAEGADLMRAIAILLNSPIPPILDRIATPQRVRV